MKGFRCKPANFNHDFRFGSIIQQVYGFSSPYSGEVDVLLRYGDRTVCNAPIRIYSYFS